MQAKVSVTTIKVAEVLEVVNKGPYEISDDGRLLLFLGRYDFLGGKSPLDTLREGRIDLARQAVLGHLER